MATEQELIDAVAAESTLDDSLITMLNGVVIQLQDAKAKDTAAAAGAPVAATPNLDAVMVSIQANTDKLKAAMVANTPVTPAVAAATA